MASEKPEWAWTPIIVALIAGGASVLVTILPFYYSSQRNLERANQANQASQAGDSESDALRKQLTALDLKFQRCEAEKVVVANNGYQAQAAKPAATTLGATTSSALEVVEHDFKFNFQGCTLVNSAVRCDFIVTNLMGDRELQLAEARIIDDSGNVYPATGFALGANSSPYSSHSKLPGAVPVKGTLKFDSVRPGTKRLAILEVTGYNWPAAGGRDTIVIKFQGIAL
jgi:hypothetical protein